MVNFIAVHSVQMFIKFLQDDDSCTSVRMTQSIICHALCRSVRVHGPLDNYPGPGSVSLRNQLPFTILNAAKCHECTFSLLHSIFKNNFIYTGLKCEYIHYADVWIFAWHPIYHLPGNVIFATVGFVCINLQP